MKKLTKYKIIAFLMLIPAIVNAQDKTNFFEAFQSEIIFVFAIIVGLVALLALFVALYALKAVIRTSTEKQEKASKEKVKKESFWRRLLNKMNDAVPVSQEATVLTSHEYDGIKELDNRLPPWWVYMFWVTIIFAAGYLLHYHVFKTGELQEEEYEREMAEARASVEAYLASAGEIIDESSVTELKEEADLIKGKELYGINCSPCHGPDGGGTVGPNLTDQYWINGGSVQDIFATIKYGVPAKGMIPWESQLTPKQMQQLTSYIITLEGTNPQNPKDPEGELYTRD